MPDYQQLLMASGAGRRRRLPAPADVVLGVSSLAGPAARRARRRPSWSTSAIVVRPAGGRRRPGVDAGPGDAARRDRRWATGSSIPRHYHFSVKFVFDRLSVPFAILSFVLCGTIGAFADRYLHREPGYNRFFVLYALFLLGMVVTSLAGTIETLFAGWELVGLSSALLVAFFQERPAPVAERPAGLGRLPHLRRRPAAGRRRAAPPAAARATSTSSWARGPGPTGTRRSRRARRSSSGCCCWSPPPASRPWCRSPAGCRGRWKGRRRRAPSSTARCRSTSARSCCCGSARSSTCSPWLSARGRRAGADHRRVRLPRRQRADRHQVAPCRSPR